MRPLHAKEGCPFPVTDNGMVPLFWFLDQGVSRRDLVRVLHWWFIDEGNCSAQAIGVQDAWNLLDELIYQNCIPGPVAAFKGSSVPAPLGADSDNWGGFVPS